MKFEGVVGKGFWIYRSRSEAGRDPEVAKTYIPVLCILMLDWRKGLEGIHLL
jgi:hypothetical protein